MSESRAAAASPSKLLAYLRLFRLPNVFTAMADIVAGFVFVHGGAGSVGVLACLLAASALIYTAGMVLNDVYDIDVDARERPQRPLPSGQIGLGWARWLGYELLLVGVALGWLAGRIDPAAAPLWWRGGAVATMLAVCVVAYDRFLKRTPIGPLTMGGCRVFNVLLGMSLAPVAEVTGSALALRFTTAQLVIAGGIGLYIAGVTWFARTEARASNRFRLNAATAVMMLGIFVLSLLPQMGGYRGSIAPAAWRVLLLLLAITIGRRCLWAALNPHPARVQVAVKNSILSLIVLDAAICLAAVNHPYWALGVLALLAPTLLLGRWVYST